MHLAVEGRPPPVTGKVLPAPAERRGGDQPPGPSITLFYGFVIFRLKNHLGAWRDKAA